MDASSQGQALPPPTEWDREMVALVRPFADRPVPPVLRYHFFANTFPLAYHYSWALLAAGKDPRGFVRFAGGFNVPEREEWGYATRSSADRKGRQHLVRVTRFNPRLVFAERNLWTSELYKSLPRSGGYPSLGSLLEGISELVPSIDIVAIYAEIPELGSYLEQAIAEQLPEKKVLVFSLSENGSNLMPPIPFSQRIQSWSPLRLFVYGGPLSMYLWRKAGRYLPLEFDADEVEARRIQELETVLLVDKEAVREGEATLVEYHRRLVVSNEGEAGRCPPFYSVYRAFNEMAWLLQSRASFRDAAEFHKCIYFHHREPEEMSIEAT